MQWFPEKPVADQSQCVRDHTGVEHLDLGFHPLLEHDGSEPV